MKSYAGKIINKGSQTVKALFGTTEGKKPKVHSGGDLRAKPSKKKGSKTSK